MAAAKPLSEFSKYVSLSVLGMIAISCYILADTFFIGQMGDPAMVAAVSLGMYFHTFRSLKKISHKL